MAGHFWDFNSYVVKRGDDSLEKVTSRVPLLPEESLFPKDRPYFLVLGVIPGSVLCPVAVMYCALFPISTISCAKPQ
jgi:hypothetical protein